MEKLLEYLKSLTKESRAQFAESCGTSEGYLRKAVSINQKLGSDLCILLERESGGVIKCEDLRPDVDWAYLRSTATPIDPSIAEAESARNGGLRLPINPERLK